MLEGVAVNEFRGDQTVELYGKQVPGLVALQQTANLPRYPFREYGALDTPNKVWPLFGSQFWQSIPQFSVFVAESLGSQVP